MGEDSKETPNSPEFIVGLRMCNYIIVKLMMDDDKTDD